MALETNEALAAKIVGDIVDDLSDRRGLDQIWDDIDAGVQKQIKAAWRQIVIEVLNQQKGMA